MNLHRFHISLDSQLCSLPLKPIASIHDRTEWCKAEAPKCRDSTGTYYSRHNELTHQELMCCDQYCNRREPGQHWWPSAGDWSPVVQDSSGINAEQNKQGGHYRHTCEDSWSCVRSINMGTCLPSSVRWTTSIKWSPRAYPLVLGSQWWRTQGTDSPGTCMASWGSYYSCYTEGRKGIWSNSDGLTLPVMSPVI